MFANQNKIIHLSINPWYYCNFSCKHCYLTTEQLNDKKLLPIPVLVDRIKEIIASGHRIGHADIYGGEVLLLPEEYIYSLKWMLHHHGVDEIELITNLSSVTSSVVNDQQFGLSVSYDFEHRQQHEHVWKNLMKLERPFTVLTLGIPEILKSDPADMIEQLNLLENCHFWEIKPYSQNQANQFDVPYADFEKFVQKVIEYPNKNFDFLNEGMLVEAVMGERNSYSDDHVYITPSGRYGVLEFDLNGNEYFQEMDTFKQYLDWTVLEKARVMSNEFCSSCEYSGKCISEHLREVRSLENSCNGFHNLIQWYDKRATI